MKEEYYETRQKSREIYNQMVAKEVDYREATFDILELNNKQRENSYLLDLHA